MTAKQIKKLSVLGYDSEMSATEIQKNLNEVFAKDQSAIDQCLSGVDDLTEEEIANLCYSIWGSFETTHPNFIRPHAKVKSIAAKSRLSLLIKHFI